MSIPRRYANEFRFWYAYGRVVGYDIANEGDGPISRDILYMFRMFRPKVWQDWCWRVFIRAIIRGARDARLTTPAQPGSV